MSALQELLARVTAAEGPDRGIDRELIRVVWGEKPEAWEMTRTEIPAYTASLDASLALVERKLPGDQSRIILEAYHVWVERESPRAVEFPRFILAALLKALIAQEPTNV